MTLDDDWLPFRDALIATASLAHRRLTEDAAARYFYALDDLEWPALRAALERFARTVEAGQGFPTPVELRRRATMRVATRPASAPAATPAAAERPLTRGEAAAILRDVAPRAAPPLARGFLAQAARIEAGAGVEGAMQAALAGVLEPPRPEDETPRHWSDR